MSDLEALRQSLLELHYLKLITRVSTRFIQFLHDILQRG